MRTEEIAPRVVEAEEKSGLKRIPSMFVTAFSFAFFTLLAVLQAQVAIQRFHAHTGSTRWWLIRGVVALCYLASSIYLIFRFIAEVREGKPSSG